MKIPWSKQAGFVEIFFASIFNLRGYISQKKQRYVGLLWPQVDNSTPNIMMEGPLNVALKTAHHEGAELDVQCEAGFGKQLRWLSLLLDDFSKFLKDHLI